MRCKICDASLDAPSYYHDSLSEHYVYPFGRVKVKYDRTHRDYICEQCSDSVSDALSEFEEDETEDS